MLIFIELRTMEDVPMHRLFIILILAAVGVGSMGSGAYSKDQRQVPSKVQKGKKAIMTTHANGTFEVKLTPQSPDDKANENKNREAPDTALTNEDGIETE